MPSKVSNYVRLRYYQYEVTFGLYMMTSREKFVLNALVIGVLAALFYGVCFGFSRFVIRSLCRLVWHLFGSYEGVEEICTSNGC